MKNLKSFSIIAIIFAIAIASPTVQAQKLNIGLFGLMGTGTTMKTYKPGLVANVLPSVAFIGKQTYHNAIYDAINAQAVVINGFMYNNKEDVYVVTGKYFVKKGGTLGIGWEHLFTGGELSAFLYAEYDTNWYDLTDISNHFFSVGLIIPLQFTVWKK